MENTDAAMLLPVDIGWNDVGSWSALWEVSEQDADGNVHHGDVIAVDTRNSYVYARRLVALVGVDDLIVVETDDAILVRSINALALPAQMRSSVGPGTADFHPQQQRDAPRP